MVVCIHRDIAFPCIINKTVFKIAFFLFNHSILSSWLIYGGVGEGYVWYGMSVSEYAGLVDVVDIWELRTYIRRYSVIQLALKFLFELF